MSDERGILEKGIARALTGKGAHVEAVAALAGLDWKLAGARPDGFPHSIFQLLNHINYWNRWVVDWLDDKEPQLPKHASGSWPGNAAPADEAQWRRAVERFQLDLRELKKRTRTGLLRTGTTKTPFEMLLTIASHTSYHIGQIVSLRQRIAAWPPPGGGLTW